VPTQGGVHEIIGPLVPDGRVVYVDNDTVAVAHARRLLTGVPGTGVCLADLRDPAAVLESPEVRQLIDSTEPVACCSCPSWTSSPTRRTRTASSAGSATPHAPGAGWSCPS